MTCSGNFRQAFKYVLLHPLTYVLGHVTIMLGHVTIMLDHVTIVL